MSTLVELTRPLEHDGATLPAGVVARVIHWHETRDPDGILPVTIALGIRGEPIVTVPVEAVRRIDSPPAGDGGGADESQGAWLAAHGSRRPLPNGGNPG